MTTTTRRAVTRSDGELGDVARGGFANLLGAVVSAVANFALVLIVARWLSASQAGVFFTATSLFLLLETLSRLGADTGSVYFISRWKALGLSDRVRPGLRVAFVPAALLSSLFAVGLLLLAPRAAELIGDSSGYSAGLLRSIAILLPCAVIYDIAVAATRGFRQMRTTVLVEKVGRPLAQLALVTLVLAVGRPGGLGYAWALPYLAALILAGLALRSLLRSRVPEAPNPQSRRWNRLIAKEFWSFSLPRAVAGVAQIALQRLDIVLVASMRGPREAAIYTAATRFLVVGQFVNQAITAPVQPPMSAALSTNAMDRARQLYRISTTWLVLASWPIFGLAATLAPVYVGLFGRDYSRGATVVVILSMAMLIASGAGLVDTVIIMAGRTSWNLQTTLLALVVNVGLDVALIPHFGLIGAALGWLGSILAANLVPLLLAWRRLGMHPFGPNTYLAYLLSGICWIALPLGARAIFPDRPAVLAMSVAVAAAVFVAGVWRWRRMFGIGYLLRRRVRDTIA